MSLLSPKEPNQSNEALMMDDGGTDPWDDGGTDLRDDGGGTDLRDDGDSTDLRDDGEYRPVG